MRRPSFASLNKEKTMLDVIYLALGVALFVALVGYAYVCERL